MDIAEARERALVKLRQIEDATHPLQLDEESGPEERAWCWIFPFDTVRYFETESFLDSVVSGPIIVDRQVGEAWIAGTALPLDEWLDMYARKKGYV